MKAFSEIRRGDVVLCVSPVGRILFYVRRVWRSKWAGLSRNAGINLGLCVVDRHKEFPRSQRERRRFYSAEVRKFDYVLDCRKSEKLECFDTVLEAKKYMMLLAA